MQEEEKEEEQEGYGDILDFSSIPSQQLFNMAEKTLLAIQERLFAKERAVRDRLTRALNTAESTQEVLVRQVYKSQGGCHLSMSRVLHSEQVDHTFPNNAVESF